MSGRGSTPRRTGWLTVTLRLSNRVIIWSTQSSRMSTKRQLYSCQSCWSLVIVMDKITYSCTIYSVIVRVYWKFYKFAPSLSMSTHFRYPPIIVLSNQILKLFSFFFFRFSNSRGSRYSSVGILMSCRTANLEHGLPLYKTSTCTYNIHNSTVVFYSYLHVSAELRHLQGVYTPIFKTH